MLILIQVVYYYNSHLQYKEQFLIFRIGKMMV